MFPSLNFCSPLLIVNAFVAWLLARGERTLNIRAALLHVMSDILGSIAALITGAIIYFTGWMLIDPILSILIGMLIASLVGLALLIKMGVEHPNILAIMLLGTFFRFFLLGIWAMILYTIFPKELKIFRFE